VAPGALGKIAGLLLGAAPNYLGEFWEGSCSVTGTFNGAPVKGVAFAELVKRYVDPEIHLKLVRNDPGLAVVAITADGWDPQAPLTYRATVERPDGTVLRNVAGMTLPVLVLDDPTLPRGEPLVVRVWGESCDGTLKGTSTLWLELSVGR
jgi:hypothetical protein